MPRLLTCVLPFLLLSLAACTGGSSEVSEERARELVDGARLDDGTSLDALGELRGTQAGAKIAREALAGGAQGDRRWAATYVYAGAGQDPVPLRELLSDPDPSIRVLAAGGLVFMGDASGFDALVELLSVEGTMAGSSPPRSIGSVAAADLALATGLADLGPPDGAGPEDLAQAQERWRAWLEQNRDRLVFDPDTRTWGTR